MSDNEACFYTIRKRNNANTIWRAVKLRVSALRNPIVFAEISRLLFQSRFVLDIVYAPTINYMQIKRVSPAGMLLRISDDTPFTLIAPNAIHILQNLGASVPFRIFSSKSRRRDTKPRQEENQNQKRSLRDSTRRFSCTIMQEIEFD